MAGHLLFAALLGAGQPAPAQAPQPSRVTSIPAKPFAALGALVAKRCAEGRFSGIVAIERAGARIFHHACSRDRAPRLDDRYKIFSLSKTLTGTAILSLIEDGKLAMDGTVGDYLADAPPGWATVTIADLLHHRSGIADLTNAMIPLWRAGPTDFDSVMKAVFAQKMGDPPVVRHDDFRYNNFGYDLLALIAARVDGRPFPQLVKARIFDRANMTDSAFAEARWNGDTLSSQPVARLVPGFNEQDGKREPATSFSFIQMGAGAIITDTDDLLAFARAYNEGRLVRRETIDASRAAGLTLRANVVYGAGTIYNRSLGCAVESHDGGSNGYVAYLANVPDRQAALVIQSNYGFVDLPELIQLARDSMMRSFDCGRSETPTD